MDLSKIEAGALELESIPFDLTALVENVSEIVAIRAQAKYLELICFVAPDVPACLVGDPIKLQQIFLNLLGNAVKFTEQGEVCLRVEQDPEDPTPGAIRMTVTDTGIGIPADKIPMLFQNFTQVDASTTRTHGDTGLGLAITKQLVKLMGGRIWIDSALGHGTTFYATIRFPVAEIGTPSPQAAALSLKNLRILVIDDNSTNRMLVRETLNHYGAQILEATDGVQALAMLHALRTIDQLPQLIITDDRMPTMNGIETIRAIQADPALAGLPIIMLSSNTRTGALFNATQLGIKAFVNKPIARAALLQQVAAALNHTSIHANPIAPPATTPETGSSAHSLVTSQQATQLRTLRVLIVDDHDDNRFLIQSYLHQMVATLDIANNGQEAVNRFQAGAYDIVLMDMQMPVMDGYTATQTIRAWEQRLGRVPTPILALTAHALQGDAQRTLDAGCTAYLAKPVLREDLLAAIQTYTATSQPAITPVPAAPTQAINPALRHMIPGYLARRREDLETCRHLLADKDFLSISALMHKMAGTGGGYGFPQLTNVARQVEQAALQQDPAAIQRHLDTLARVLVEIGDGTAQP